MSTAKAYQILLVDDDPKILLLLQDLLEANGYAVQTAETGAAAFAAIRTTPPDLILLDILLADLDGMEVCGQLRATPTTRNIPVIFLTAHDTPSRIEQAMNMGASDILGKPVNTADLLLRIRAMLETHHIPNEHQRLLKYITRVKALQSQAEELDETG